MAYVEAQLERAIALGMLPRGQFGSEEKLAREFDCCRGTVREALRRLAARGLVVQRSGRKTRAVALDESLTLENLGLALHHRHSEEGRRLLEGFFSLKRQVLVELLADCCAKASEAQVSQLEATCYALWDAAHWHPGERCAQLEFELLRLAAHAAARPGHLLLIQSLQRALRGNAARMLSFMGGESLREWAMCAMHALSERDARALTHQLPALLKACDEGVLDAFAPVPQEHASPEVHSAEESLLEDSAPATAHDDALEARSCVEVHGLDARASDIQQGDAPEAHSCVEARSLDTRASDLQQGNTPETRPNIAERGLDARASDLQQGDELKVRACVEERGINARASAPEQDDALEARPCVGDHRLGRFASVAEDTEVLRVEPCPHELTCPAATDSEALISPASHGLIPCEPGGKSSGEDVTGAALGDLSDCWIGWDASTSEGASSPGLLPPDSADKPA
ncbi:FadR/GntR family transcriptional regulator [Corallococcus exercitus]|uniref:FadR/GntR family transcriptional regulator n=1 Tax=Corallococcus exercitus TaxID=2316736 RepID=UPI0035D4E589